MRNDSDRIQRHFDRTSAEFDSIYSGKKSEFRRLLDRLLRWDMQERLRLTLEACRPVEGKSVLDVGCGTGRFCFPLAQDGARHVVGIDFAPSMIERAREIAREMNLAERCEFTPGDIMEYSPGQTFDYIIAIGLFDYVKDDRPLLVKFRKLTSGKLVASFPRADTWRAPIRKLRLALLNCPVYFYTEKRIRDHLLISGFTLERIRKVGKLYFVEAR